MRFVLLLALLGASVIPEVHCALRLSSLSSSNEARRDPPRESREARELKEEVKGVGDRLKKAKDKALEWATRGPGHFGTAKKILMDPIEVMRAMMCLNRQRLIDHVSCMEWMIDACRDETSGEGYCKKLRDYLLEKCRHGDERGCDYSEELGVSLKRVKKAEKAAQKVEEKEEEEEEEEEDEIDDEDEEKESQKVAEQIKEEEKEEEAEEEEEETLAGPAPAAAAGPAPAPAPTDGLSMKENVGLPSQGYNEHSPNYVQHNDMETMTRDWRKEWPQSNNDHEESIDDICDKNPRHAWCRLRRSKAARRKYAASHP